MPIQNNMCNESKSFGRGGENEIHAERQWEIGSGHVLVAYGCSSDTVWELFPEVASNCRRTRGNPWPTTAGWSVEHSEALPPGFLSLPGP